MSRKTVSVMFFGSIALWIAAVWLSEALPEPRLVREELLENPVQIAYDAPAFTSKAGGVEYAIQPRFSYDLYGLVVSRHDSAAWWDYIHKEWNDNLNVVDLCVVWGENIRRDSYRAMSYSHDQWTCWAETRSNEAYAAFDTTSVSNSHLLTDNPRIAAALRSARVGDQVHVRGYLADYKNPANGFQRISSTVRTDTGNGACEVVYVEEFEVLKAGGAYWRKIKWIAVLLLAFSLVMWFRLPLRS